jgi:hypothetical protein
MGEVELGCIVRCVATLQRTTLDKRNINTKPSMTTRRTGVVEVTVELSCDRGQEATRKEKRNRLHDEFDKSR